MTQCCGMIRPGQPVTIHLAHIGSLAGVGQNAAGFGLPDGPRVCRGSRARTSGEPRTSLLSFPRTEIEGFVVSSDPPLDYLRRK